MMIYDNSTRKWIDQLFLDENVWDIFTMKKRVDEMFRMIKKVIWQNEETIGKFGFM